MDFSNGMGLDTDTTDAPKYACEAKVITVAEIGCHIHPNFDGRPLQGSYSKYEGKRNLDLVQGSYLT